MTTTTLIIAGILAFGLGIWLGLPGRYDQTAEDIERIMAEGGRERRKVKQRFTPLAWVQRKVSGGSPRGRGRRERRSFRLEHPDDRR